MTATATTAHTADHTAGSPFPPPTNRPWWRRPSGIGAAVVVVGSFALWAYAFSGVARRTAPDTLADKAFVAAAKPLCAAAQADIAELPSAISAKTAPERAETLEIATSRVEQLGGELRRSLTPESADFDILTRWFADWDRYVANRRAYATTLRTDSKARFQLDARSTGEGITKAMDNLATVNRMDECATPGDVG